MFYLLLSVSFYGIPYTHWQMSIYDFEVWLFIKHQLGGKQGTNTKQEQNAEQILITQIS